MYGPGWRGPRDALAQLFQLDVLNKDLTRRPAQWEPSHLHAAR